VAEPAAEALAVPAEEGESAPVEMESFYTFVRAPRRRPDRAPREAREARKPHEGARSRGADRPPKPDAPRERAPAVESLNPRADGPREDNPGSDGPRKKHRREEGPRKNKGKPDAPKPAPRPSRPEKPIDPDNPFAALMALKTRG
jgi:ATP-dependent RNA helicase SUPV3L1/SUV3